MIVHASWLRIARVLIARRGILNEPAPSRTPRSSFLCQLERNLRLQLVRRMRAQAAAQMRYHG